MTKKITSKIAFTGLLATLATITFLLENLFPPLILPGAKMGLSNIFILLAFITLGKVSAFAVLIVKAVLGSLFAGNISAIIYSLPAGAIALTLEVLLLTLIKRISIVCASVFGSVVNITVQNVIFCIVTDTINYLSYLPYFVIIGVVSGIIVGFSVYILVKRMPFNKFI